MKEIFKKIKGREWDWFNHPDKFNYNITRGIEIITRLCHRNDEPEFISYHYSLADLLANKSWCKAVWGDKIRHPKFKFSSALFIIDSQYHLLTAFRILQQQGEEAVIKYIKETMI